MAKKLKLKNVVNLLQATQLVNLRRRYLSPRPSASRSSDLSTLSCHLSKMNLQDWGFREVDSPKSEGHVPKVPELVLP